MAQPKKKITLPLWRWLLLLSIPTVWCLLSHFGLLEFFANRTLDWRFRARGELAAPIKVIYIDVDSRSIEEIGNFPWSRHYFARVADALVNEAHVRAVGFDFVLSPNGLAESADQKKVRASDLEIAKFLFKGPPVVFGASYAAAEFRTAEGKITHRDLPLLASDPRPLEEIQQKTEPPEVTGFATGPTIWSPPFIGVIDTDHADTRVVPIWTPTNTRNFYHVALELARLYWGLPAHAIKLNADQIDFVRQDGSLQASIPLRDRQLVDINWFSAWESPYNPRQSFSIVYAYAEMLHSEKEEERKSAQEFFANDDFKDSVVLIGPVDPLLQDLAKTPFDDVPVPKVGVHGNLLKTIVSGLYLKRLPEQANNAIIFGLTLLVSTFAAAGGTGGLRSKLTAGLLLTAYIWLTFKLFEDNQLILPVVAPLGSIFTTTFAAIIMQLVEEERQKGRIKGMFGAYVSPELVSRMVESGEDPQLGGHEDVITAYFSDIQGFSGFSEKMAPAQLVDLMNEYLTVCTDIIQEEGGTLDKYIGDAVVAMFGAPLPLKDHAYRACVATQRVQARIVELREGWRQAGDRWPEIVWSMQARLGLNTGPAIIGNMGSRTRFNYTMMGDNVNLAARMESGAKSWGVYTMCTEATKLSCEEHGGDRIVFRQLGRIVVMGRTTPVPVFEVVGLKESLPPTARECIALFEQGLDKYHARDWDGAIAIFKQSAEIEPKKPSKITGVKSNPSLVYVGIASDCKHEPPPENWDGVYVMKEK